MNQLHAFGQVFAYFAEVASEDIGAFDPDLPFKP